MPATHTADFQTAAVKATNLDAVEKINVGIETDKVRKHLNIVADAPEIRIQDKTGSAPEVTATTMAIVAEANTTHFRAGTTTFAEGAETKGNVKFQSSTGATTHAEIVGSSGKLELQDGGLGLKRGSNVSVSGTPSAVIQEITGPHARESAVLKKYPEVPLASNVQSGYTVTASNANDTRPVWQVFDGSNATLWGTNGGAYNSGNPGTVASSGSYPGEIITLADSTQHDRGHWMKIKFPHKVRLSSYYISAGSPDRRPASISILGSNDDSNWYIVKDVHSVGSEDRYTIEISASTAYRYALLLVHSIVGSDNQMVIDTIEYRGYEEVGAGDDSVDTTVKSVYNAPDLTSAALYIDAAKTGTSVTDQSGSTPSVTVTATGVTYDSTENAWELSGAATSNIVSGSLGFEGDQPHSVSAWVKADQLNGDGLFHVGTADGEGDAASRVGFVNDSHISWGGDSHFFSNTEWHNVTYTYNGEGSDKKLYLDGRLVGTAKNEDTFGEYPPFAMTNYSEYGYTVSASSEFPSPYHAPVYRAFDNNTNPDDPYRWTSADNKYSSSGSYTGSESHTDIDGNTEAGEWIKIEMPHKLKVSYFEIAPYPTNGSQSWRNYAILGSNDNVNWYQVQKVSGLSAGNGLTAGSVVPTGTYKNYAFKYFVFIWSSKAADANQHVSMGELKIFGHRENDLVRFPDPTNVLKYPHMELSPTSNYGNGTDGSAPHAERGYVATSSTGDAGRLFNGTKSHFTSFGSNGGGTTTYGGNTNHTLSGFARTGVSNEVTTEVGGATHTGTWVDLETPRKLKLSEFKVCFGPGSAYAPHSPTNYRLLGRNATTDNWNLLFTIDGSYPNGTTPPSTGGTDKALHTIATSDQAFYKYHRWVCTRLHSTNSAGNGTVGGATASRAMIFYGVEYYGTESGDVIARVGDGYDGKVRNLRVYSTALSDARVQEIFDADKDEFGLAKSSISVYRGHLGVGTDKPKAALTVMDEVVELEEFPPRAMSNYETYIEGHGVFKASASEYTGNSVHAAWNAFAHGAAEFWLMGQHAGYNLVSGEYEDNEFRLSSETSMGQWIKLEIPYLTNVTKFILKPRLPGAEYQAPKSGELWGSKDNYTWTKLHTFTDIQYYAGHTTFKFENSEFYKYYGLVVTKVGGGHASNDYIGIVDLRFFGTREQGASTLHNGELTLTRNLTVPRIGPPLDADDTPRRDRLVVEYNTSTNPTENGVVKDTSGGLDGRLHGAYYDAVEKALILDNVDDYIAMDAWTHGTGFIHSFSGWIKFKSPEGTWDAMYGVGDATGSSLTNFTTYAKTNDNYFRTEADGSGAYLDHTFEFTGNLDKWLHIVVVKSSARMDSTRMYMNGDLLPQTNVTNGNYENALPDSPQKFFLGARPSDVTYFANMDYSNVKFYDVALTADEVKRLYDMGRLGNVIAQPLYITAPLHAPGVPIQTVTKQVHDRAAYSAADNIHIAAMDINITPKFANSKIKIEWNVSFEVGHDNVFRIYRDGTLIGYNSQGGNSHWSGAAVTPYDTNTDSTPAHIHIVWVDTPNTTSTITYKLYKKDANNMGFDTFYLNRTKGSGGSNNNENGVSHAIVTEIAQ